MYATWFARNGPRNDTWYKIAANTRMRRQIINQNSKLHHRCQTNNQTDINHNTITAQYQQMCCWNTSISFSDNHSLHYHYFINSDFQIWFFCLALCFHYYCRTHVNVSAILSIFHNGSHYITLIIISLFSLSFISSFFKFFIDSTLYHKMSMRIQTPGSLTRSISNSSVS